MYLENAALADEGRISFSFAEKFSKSIFTIFFEDVFPAI